MPKKRQLKKQTVQFIVNGAPVSVVLHPPGGRRTSWYAYWPGLVTSKTTGQSDLTEAIRAAEHMVRHGGTLAELDNVLLSDEDFEQVQRAHYGKKRSRPHTTGPRRRSRTAWRPSRRSSR